MNVLPLFSAPKNRIEPNAVRSKDNAAPQEMVALGPEERALIACCRNLPKRRFRLVLELARRLADPRKIAR